jgi:hypothetical protein
MPLSQDDPVPNAPAQRSWWRWLWPFHRPRNSPNAAKAVVPPLAKKAITRPGSKIDLAANRKMILQLRDDAADSQLVAAEIIRETLRRNPVNIQIRDFMERIDPKRENTTPDQKAKIVNTAMNSLNLADALSKMDVAFDEVAEIGQQLVSSYALGLLEAWPKCREHIQHRWLDDPDQAGEDIRKQIRSAVESHREVLIEIQTHFGQLKAGHQRYIKIMTRSENKSLTNVLDVAGEIAGFIKPDAEMLVKSVGFGTNILVGAWQGMSVTKVEKQFEMHVDKLRCSTRAFIENTEREVELVIASFLQVLRDFNQRTIAVLESVMKKMDLTKIYHRLHAPDPTHKIDDNGRQFFEIVLSNLRDQKMSARSEANIKEMLGIHE